MKKSELIAAIAATASISNAEAERTMDAFTAVARTALKEGKRVALTDFGAFSTRDQAARTARNPKTGEPVEVPAKTVVKFKVFSELADHVA